MSDGQSKYWCFTFNNYTDEDEENLRTWFKNTTSYATYGYEVGECGTPHLQGYFELHSKRRFRTIKNLLSHAKLDRMHLELRRGTAQQASDYCHKEDLEAGYFFGELSVSKQGSRTDIEDLKRDLMEKKSLRNIAEEHFGSFLRYQRGILAFRNVVSDQRMWEVDVQVLWGPTGTGKTRRVYETVENLSNLYSHDGGPWFDGYDGQEEVLFDEYSGSYFSLCYLLKLLDRYPLRVPIKGGFASFVPKRIWITSNYPPEEWYPNAKQEHVNAMLRRISNVEKVE